MNNSAHFSTKARVVDLLGREQIADAPTAITELLKNAIDAAASNAEVRYNTKTRCLEIEDDGLGMRPYDLLNKWMVLATDSKHGQEVGHYDKEWSKYATKEQIEKLKHKPLGEKGIGRLAVAALGNGTLVWTRWGKGNDAKYSLLLVHWHFFRHPGLLLDEIKFPYIELNAKDDPKVAAIQLCNDFSHWFKENQKEWQGIIQNTLVAEIEDDLTRIFPKAINEIIFNREMGTLFGVLKAGEGVDEIFEKEKDQGEDYLPSEGLRTFVGFCDPFGIVEKKINVNAFIDGKIAYQKSESHGDRSFWEPDDFKVCDHFIDINIDDNGFVKGKIIKGKTKQIDYQRSFSNIVERGSRPGKFRIVIGYIPGDHSILTHDEFQYYNKRLKAFGGLYVYRDGIRVMPYGRIDEDFLEFEERRSRQAGRAYFSYRRMFGAIYVDSMYNENLKDKAGREGFIRNTYFRTFKDISKAIFIDIAKTYFSSEAEQKTQDENAAQKGNDPYSNRSKDAEKEFLEKFKEAKKLLEQEEKLVSQNTQKLHLDIEQFHEKTLVPNMQELGGIENEFYLISENFYSLLDKLISEIPPVVSLKEKHNLAWEDYLVKRDEFERTTQKELNKIVAKIEKINIEFKDEKDRINNINEKLQKNKNNNSKLIATQKNSFISQIQAVQTNADTWVQKQENKLLETFTKRVGTDSAQEIAKDVTGEKASLMEEAIAMQHKLLREEYLPFWNTATDQLKYLADAKSAEFAVGAMNREIEKMQEKASTLSELAQFGLVVETISHEYHEMFNDAVRVFSNLKKAGLPDLVEKEIYHLEEIFKSIDERLGFLEPLYKRKKGGIGNINGMAIRDFIESKFSAKLRGNINISYTKKFIESTITDIKIPVLYAAIFNIVNNALYWVTKTNDKPEIRLCYYPAGFIISDSGPGISGRDRESIFEPFFTRKPHGRGLGLYIAKTTLEANGLNLYIADEPQKGALPGANFVIKKSKTSDDEQDSNEDI